MTTSGPGSGSGTPAADSSPSLLLDSAQSQLDALRAAIDVRLAALDAVLADPSRSGGLESIIRDLARLATDEARATAARACAGLKLEADTEMARVRKAAQSEVDNSRATIAELRGALDASQLRVSTLEREKDTVVRAAREQFEARLSDQRGTLNELERAATGLERRLAEAEAALATERAATASLRETLEQAEADGDAWERDRATAHSDLEHALQALAQEQQLRHAADIARVQIEQALEAAEAAHLTARESAARLERELEALGARELEEQAEHDSLIAKLANEHQTRAEREALQARLDEALAAIEALTSSEARSSEEAAGLRARLSDAEEATALTHIERDVLRGDAETMQEQLAAARADLDIARADLELMRAEIEELGAARMRTTEAAAPSMADLPEPIATAAPTMAIGNDDWMPVPLATRYAFSDRVEIQINGSPGVLCDLSTSGCQLLFASTVRPNQSIKLLLPFEPNGIACTGRVVWAQLEPPAAGRALAYRAGVQFTRADESLLEAFIARHRGTV